MARMSSSFEKSVKGATKIKTAPPKSKYIEHILIATHTGEAGVGEIFRALQNRLRDATWTVVFKSLITVHLMIREGSPDVTLAYIARHRNILAISTFSDVQTQGRNIRHYANYLTERARGYKETKCDFVRGSEGRLEKLSVEKGLLRETEAVQHQITALLKCDVLDNEPENEITVTVFRMLVLDLLAMFHVMNQAMINILGHFFEMAKTDAERALDIYKNFAKQTDFVVGYLSTARQYEHQTRVEVPKLKHAPLNLVRQLEEYLKDGDFEVNRRQYLAEQDNKKFKGVAGKAFKKDADSRVATGRSFPDAKQSYSKPAQQPTPPPTKSPDPDLIDFFESIEQNQQPMAQQQQPNHYADNSFPIQSVTQQTYQPNGFAPQQNGIQVQGQFPQQTFSGFSPATQQTQPIHQSQPMQLSQQVQSNFTGAGFGGYTPQPFQSGGLSSMPQDSQPNFQPQPQQQLASMPTAQNTNPFRQSMLMSNTGGAPLGNPPMSSSVARQSTNPFAQSLTPPNQQSFSPPNDQQFQPSSLVSSATGTNPFAKALLSQRPQTSGGLGPQPTGNTNPFRQSQFVNTSTGVGWQNNQQPIGGGLDHLETVPVFPRPLQQQAWQP